jgi:hypothetical protein
MAEISRADFGLITSLAMAAGAARNRIAAGRAVAHPAFGARMHP